MSRLKTLFNAGNRTDFCIDIGLGLTGSHALTDQLCLVNPKGCGYCPLNYSRLERELIRKGFMQLVAYQDLKEGA